MALECPQSGCVSTNGLLSPRKEMTIRARQMWRVYTCGECTSIDVKSVYMWRVYKCGECTNVESAYMYVCTLAPRGNQPRSVRTQAATITTTITCLYGSIQAPSGWCFECLACILTLLKAYWLCIVCASSIPLHCGSWES